MSETYLLERSAPIHIYRKLQLWCAAADAMRAAYAAFVAAPDRVRRETYAEKVDDFLMADGATYGALMAEPLARRRTVYQVSGRMVWLSPSRGARRPSIVDAVDNHRPCPNCHGAGEIAFIFGSGEVRSSVCHQCKGVATISQPSPHLQPQGVAQ